MKLLFTCCGAGSRSRTVAEEEKRSLVPEETMLMRRKRGRKRGRVVGVRRSSVQASEWRPTLSSISEDDIFTGAERDQTHNLVRGSEGSKRNKKSTPKPPSHYEYQYDPRGSSFSTLLPAFAPMPFLF